MVRYRIIIKTDQNNVLTFIADSFSKTELHIEFTDIENKYNMYPISWVIGVKQVDK